jgi:hypothetical protein
MAGYWQKVLSGAWDKTWKPLGWNLQKTAVVLVAIGTVIAAGFHLGLAAMITSAVGYLWIVAPVLFAAVILFVWGIFDTQAKMYAELSGASTATISELSDALARAKEPPPDYEAWQHVDHLSLKQAAFLWCDLSPRNSMPPNVKAWFTALASAVRRGDLTFEATATPYVNMDVAREMEKLTPTLDTVVKRGALQAFAKKNGHDPKFLRDARSLS